MVIFIFLVWKYAFCVNLIQKFKRVILRRSLGPSLECLIDNRRPPPLINFSIFFYSEHSFFPPHTPPPPPPNSPPPPPPHSPSLINYWGKFSSQVWNDILMVNFLQSRKRSDPPVVCFVLQFRAKKPTQCFAL